jgi:hypothetical protein
VWQIELTAGGEMAQFRFQVQAYVKPEYEVKVQPDRPFYIAGEPIQVAVQADYYYGQPVADAELVVRVFRHRGGYWYWQGGELVAELRGQTGPDGSFETSVATDRIGELATYVIEGEVTDAARRAVTGHARANVYPAAIELDVSQNRYGYRADEPIEVRSQVRDHHGQAAAGVAVEFVVQRYDRDGYIDVVRRRAVTDPTGMAAASFGLQAPGWYQILVTASDSAGRTVQQATWAWVFERHGGGWWWESGLDIKADRDAYAPGDSAQLLIRSPVGGKALVTLQRDGVYDELVVDLAAGATLVEVPVQPEYTPNVYAHVHVWQPLERGNYLRGEAQLLTASVNLNVPAEDRRLSVTMSADRTQYEPGEPARLTIQVRDARGGPAEAEVSLAVVDKAIFALAPDQSGDIFDAFWSQRPDGVSTLDGLRPSLDYGIPEDARGGQPGLPPSAPTPAASVPGAGQAPSVLRQNFLDTAYWNAVLTTGPDGELVVEVPLPDNLTTWLALAKAVSRDTRAGQGSLELLVTKDVVARPVLPRFAVQGDHFAVDVLAQNFTTQALTGQVALDAPGLTLLDGGTRQPALPSGQTVASRWTCVASQVGRSDITGSVATAGGDDGVRLSLPIEPFSVPQRSVAAGVVEAETTERVDLPFNAGPESSQVRLDLSPGVAVGIMAGLEDLIGYPYGCVEQTMSRVLPNAIVARALRELGIQAPEIEQRLPDLVAVGLQKLYGFQLDNGAWGWWGNDEGNIYTTAYVLFGLTMTEQAGFQVDDGVLDRGFAWLQANLEQTPDPRLRAYAAYVMAVGGRADRSLVASLFAQRSGLDAFALAALASALHLTGDSASAATVGRELVALAVQTPVTAHWSESQSDAGYRWRSMASAEKATAMALDTLTALRPSDPILPKAARWLMDRRWGRSWVSTHDTAFAILALTDYLKVSGELRADFSYQVLVNGTLAAEGRVTPATVTTAITPVIVDGSRLNIGANQVVIRQQGTGGLYYTLVSQTALYYDDFKPVAPSGLGLSVERSYRLVDGRPGQSWRAGDLVEVTLRVDAPDDLWYMILEDRLPAGLEALNQELATEAQEPGRPTLPGSPMPWRWRYNRYDVYDDHVTFFLTYMWRGEHTFTYLARALTPGQFSARPAEVYAMYKPEVWGRSGSDRVAIDLHAIQPRPPLASDYNRDCLVTAFDAHLVAEQWGSVGQRDPSGDGRISMQDVLLASGRQGRSCISDPTGPPPSTGMRPRASLSVGRPGVVVGQTFSVRVRLDGVTDLGGAEFELSYPGYAARLLSVEAEGMLVGGNVVHRSLDAGRLRVGAYTTGAGSSGAGGVLTLTFVSTAPGELRFGLARPEVVDTRGAVAHTSLAGPVAVEATGTLAVFLPHTVRR